MAKKKHTHTHTKKHVSKYGKMCNICVEAARPSIQPSTQPWSTVGANRLEFKKEWDGLRDCLGCGVGARVVFALFAFPHQARSAHSHSSASAYGVSTAIHSAARESALRKEVAPAYTVEVTDDSRLRLVTAN